MISMIVRYLEQLQETAKCNRGKNKYNVKGVFLSNYMETDTGELTAIVGHS